MRISDWSSDVCSSDLVPHAAEFQHVKGSVVIALTRLTKENGTRAVELDRDADQHQQRPDQPKHEQGDELVFEPLDRMVEAGDREIGRASCRERVCQYV